jgi:hypothetical protein
VLAVTALSWDGVAQSGFEVPGGCGSAAEFRSELTRLTGDAAGTLPASLRIASVVGGGYELRLQVGEDLRVLRDPECRTLWRSAIVISAAALAPTRPEAPAPAFPPETASSSPSLDPTLTPAPSAANAPNATAPAAPAAGSTPAISPSVTVKAASAGAPATRPASAAASRARAAAPAPSAAQRRLARRRRPRPASNDVVPAAVPPAAPHPFSPAEADRFGVSVAAGVSGGVLPGLAASVELEARMEAALGGVSVVLRHWPTRSESREGRGLDVSAWGGRAAGLIWIDPRLQLVAGLELNRLAGAAQAGVSGRNTDVAWQLAPTLGLSLIAWKSRYLRLELGAAGRLSLLRPRFVVTGFGDLYRVPALGADVMLRGVWFFR